MFRKNLVPEYLGSVSSIGTAFFYDCLDLILQQSPWQDLNPRIDVMRGRKWIFRRVPKIAKGTISFVISVRMSAWNNSASTGRIFMNFGIEYFSKNCRENPSFIKIGQE